MTGTTITTLGNVDVSGVQPVDVCVAGTGATATLTNDTLVASGVQGLGVLAEGGGVATISGGSITVSGTDADGLLASGAGSVISTSGGTKIVSSATPLNFVIAGAEAANSAIINLTDTSVATSGPGTSGVEAQSGGDCESPERHRLDDGKQRARRGREWSRVRWRRSAAPTH